MASDTTGQSMPDDPHRPEGPRMSPPGSSVEFRKCLRCFKTKPLQDFKSWRKEGSYVTGCTACREHEQSRRRVTPGVRAVSGIKRSIDEVDKPQEQRIPTPQHVSNAARAPQSSPVPSIRPIVPRIAAADLTPEGSPHYYPRGVRPDDTPAMRRVRQDQVAISRAHRVQARDDLQPSPSQTPPLQEIMRGQQELDAISRGHEEEFLAGGSPSPTPDLRDLLAQQRGGVAPSSSGVVPSSSAFGPQNASVPSPSVVPRSFPLRESLGLNLTHHMNLFLAHLFGSAQMSLHCRQRFYQKCHMLKASQHLMISLSRLKT
ncbi:hypothetical protein E4U50_004494 [Claviceps purpurea]|nr:hypothetical protein E4U50_004494 [Claviceps purpurea]